MKQIRYGIKDNKMYYHLKDYIAHLKELYAEEVKNKAVNLTEEEWELMLRNRFLSKNSIVTDDDDGEEYFKASDIKRMEIIKALMIVQRKG